MAREYPFFADLRADQERIHIVAHQTRPNELLRAARLRLSPSKRDEVMSRQELAKAVNAKLFEETGRHYGLNANYIGKLENGVIGWPNSQYRRALRTVLSLDSDAELGFRSHRPPVAESASVAVVGPVEALLGSDRSPAATLPQALAGVSAPVRHGEDEASQSAHHSWVRPRTRLDTVPADMGADQERIHIVAYRPRSNDLLREARLTLRSPTGSGRPMSRQELAEAVNAYLYEHAGRTAAIAGHYIGNLERGQTRWPSAHYRQALRAVLGRATDAELGFYIIKGHASDADAYPTEPAAPTGLAPGVPPGVATLSEGALHGADGGHPSESAGAAVVQVRVNAGATITVVCHGGPPVCVAVVAGPVELLVEPVVAGPANPASAPAGRPSVNDGARVYSLAGQLAR